MELSQLFSRGSHLSDVPPDFRGMPLAEWQSKQITLMANSKAATAWREKMLIKGEPRLNRKGVEHARVFAPE